MMTNEPDYVDDPPLRSQFEPYQQKIFYQVQEDSSELSVETETTDEDILFANKQPFMTTTKVGYDALLKQVRIPEFTKRSDIMITSTLSMSIFPKDKRMIQNVHLANMNEDELIEYIDQKNAFKALNKEIEYQIGIIKEKDKEFKENYMKSFIHRSNFLSKTLSEFKGRVEKLNSNKK